MKQLTVPRKTTFRWPWLVMLVAGTLLVGGTWWFLLGRPARVPATSQAVSPSRDFTELALLRARQGDVEGALEALGVAIAANSDGVAAAYYYRGLIRAELQEFDAAIADFQQAIAANPHNAEAYAALGTTYVAMGRPATALESFNKALQLAPDDASTFANRGHAYMRMSMTDLAMADFNRAIELDPTLVAAYFNRGVLYLEMGEAASALADFDTCVKLMPEAPAPYFNRAVTYLELRERDRAVADLQTYLELSQDEAGRRQAQALLDSLPDHQRDVGEPAGTNPESR